MTTPLPGGGYPISAEPPIISIPGIATKTISKKEFYNIISLRKGSVDLYKCEYFNHDQQVLIFSEINFIDNLDIPQVDFPLIFIKCSINGINFQPANYTNIGFRYCIFKNDVNLNNLIINESIDFDVCLLNSKLNINGGTYTDFRIAADVTSMEIESGNFKRMKIYSSGNPEERYKLQHLKIEFDQVSGSIELSKLQINNIYFSGIIHGDTKLIVYQIEYNFFMFTDVFNNGRIRISDLHPVANPDAPGRLVIERSNLGKMDVFNVNFADHDVINISDSYLIDATFVNVDWPPAFYEYSIETSAYDLRNIKEIYRQLKYSYSKQGDSVLEHRFHALEMDTYRKYLSLKRKKAFVDGWYKRWRIDRQTSLILWFSSWSSEYGQSIKRPLVIWLLVGLLLFPIMSYLVLSRVLRRVLVLIFQLLRFLRQLAIS